MVFSPSRCFLYLTFSGGGFNYGEMKRTFVSQLLRMSTNFIAPVTHGKFFSRTRHFVQMFVLVFFKFWFFFSLIRPFSQTFNQSVLISRYFYFCIFFKLLDYVLVWRQICNSNLINDLHNSAYYMWGRVDPKNFLRFLLLPSAVSYFRRALHGLRHEFDWNAT